MQMFVKFFPPKFDDFFFYFRHMRDIMSRDDKLYVKIGLWTAVLAGVGFLLYRMHQSSR